MLRESLSLSVVRDCRGWQVQRAQGGADLADGDLQIPGRGCEVTVTEQQLDRAQVGAGFQQMNREGSAGNGG
jgi:hypothetical protein